MTRPTPTNKIVWAKGDNAAKARAIFKHIEDGHIDIPSRWGRAYFDLEDDGDSVVGFTNIGWERLGIVATRLGQDGIRGFIGTYARFDPKRQEVVVRASRWPKN